LRSGGLADGVVDIVAENAAQTAYLKQRCVAAFTEAAQAVTGRLVAVTFTSQTLSTASESAGDTLTPPGKLDPYHALQNFLEHAGNRFAVAASTAVAHSPGHAYNPLYIHGIPGVGKSHLLQGLASSLHERGTPCLYLTARAWTAELMCALEQDRAEAFRRSHHDLGALLLDDVQLLSGCDHSQDELFSIFNMLVSGQRQIVLAANCSPAELKGVAPRLVTRFTAGLVATMDEPPFEGRLAILRRHATLRLIEAPDEVLAHVAANTPVSCRDLVATLVRVDSLARMTQTPITIALADEAIHRPAQPCNDAGIDLCCIVPADLHREPSRV
jgi:chromosomal replication initiator protein